MGNIGAWESPPIGEVTLASRRHGVDAPHDTVESACTIRFLQPCAQLEAATLTASVKVCMEVYVPNTQSHILRYILVRGRAFSNGFRRKAQPRACLQFSQRRFKTPFGIIDVPVKAHSVFAQVVGFDLQWRGQSDCVQHDQ